MRKIFLYLTVLSLFSSIVVGQKKTVTNADLDKFKQRRLAAEAEYERVRETLGLPSLAELERREAERRQFLSEFAQKAAAQKVQTANAFQVQAFAIRTEIAAANAEINYLVARVNEIPAPQTYYSVGYLPGFNYGYGSFGGVGFPQFPNGASSTQISGGQIGGSIRIGGGNSQITVGGVYGNTTIRQTGNLVVSADNLQAPRGGLNAGTFPTNNFGGVQTNLNFGGVPYTAGILSAPFTLPTQQNITREELLARLRFLEQTRAGLFARFEVLEEEARRAGVRID